MFELKKYQKRTLEKLRNFLKNARRIGSKAAFEAALREQNRPVALYRTHDLGDIPYVCLRLPTGGGKTVLASYAIREAARHWLEQDFPLVLWLVPTNTIRQQTLEALRQPGHPYRQALDDHFRGNVKVVDIGDVTQIRPHDLGGKVCVVVGTLATLRVKDKTGRKIYADNEEFEPHFGRIAAHEPGLDRREEEPEKGRVRYSFANLCHLYKPLVIMDEAHNARTKLTFDVLKRLHPSCIIEFTATPQNDRKKALNVLYSVTATELRTEKMIKLPIMLYEHQTWQQSVCDAIATRRNLAEKAESEPDHIRPIVLFQAESKDKEVTVEVLRNYLIENENIAPERIAVATGNQRELDSVDLSDPDCKIDFVITMQALKEGWDCPFAYVFCSMADIRSGKDVEQLLGRVLRMPYARERTMPELNRAYAHIASPVFTAAAQNLRDHLVNMGFEKPEADFYIQPEERELFDDNTDECTSEEEYRESGPLTFGMTGEMDTDKLELFTRTNVQIDNNPDGSQTVSVYGTITQEMETQISEAVPSAERKKVRATLKQHREKQQARHRPSVRPPFSAPSLCAWVQGELELVESEFFLEIGQWALLDFKADLTKAEFEITDDAHIFEVNIMGEKVVYKNVDRLTQSRLNIAPSEWTEPKFLLWMDREVHQPDISQNVMVEFLRRLFKYLREKRGYDLDSLTRAKYLLADAIIEKIGKYRQEAADNGFRMLTNGGSFRGTSAVQQPMFGGEPVRLESSFEYGFRFDAQTYAARNTYHGPYQFQKHISPLIGDLKDKGEEFACAVAIDRLPQVRTWVRNIPRQPHSFWLPTSKYKFYPDFVAELTDDRVLVVEYKGEHIQEKVTEKEKDNIGQLWETNSSGKALFMMAVSKDEAGRDVYAQIRDKIKKASLSQN